MSKLIDFIEKPLSGEWGEEDSDGNGTPVLRTTNFNNDGSVNYSNVVKRKINPDKLKSKYLQPGDILIEKSGGSPNQPVGRVVFFEGPRGQYLFNNFTSILRVNREDIFSKYLFYQLFNKYRNGETKKYQNKTTGILNLKLDRFTKEVEITLCDFKEQKQIAQNLNKVSDLIALRKKQLEELDQLIKYVFYDMFGDPVVNDMGWEILNFKNVAIIDTKMTKDFQLYWDYPHIGIDSIEKNTGEIIDYKLVKESNIISGKYIFTPNHIIYSKIRPNLNKVALPSFNGLCSADAYPILTKIDMANKYYLAYILRSDFFLSYILDFSGRTNIPKVNKKQLEGFILPVPPLSLQNQFASIVTKIEDQKALVKQSIEETQQLFDSLMSQYFD